jgi:hypothetical protein
MGRRAGRRPRAHPAAGSHALRITPTQHITRPSDPRPAHRSWRSARRIGRLHAQQAAGKSATLCNARVEYAAASAPRCPASEVVIGMRPVSVFGLTQTARSSNWRLICMAGGGRAGRPAEIRTAPAERPWIGAFNRHAREFAGRASVPQRLASSRVGQVLMSPCLPRNPLKPAESAFVARAYRSFCRVGCPKRRLTGSSRVPSKPSLRSRSWSCG